MNWQKIFQFELLFQWRHGFHLVYLVTTVLYVAILKLVPGQLLDYLLPIILYTDPAILGFFFIGGAMLLERDQHTMEGLFVTPFSTEHYIFSKTTSYAFLSVVVGLAVAVSVLGTAINFILFVPSFFLSSIFFTLLGITLVCRVRNLNHYLVSTPLYIIPVVLPMVTLFLPSGSILFYLYPAFGSFRLIQGAVSTLGVTDLLFSWLNLLVYLIPVYLMAKRDLKRFIRINTGGEQ